MNIGIITMQWPHNYGALLQAYALSKVLEEMGHNAEIINFLTRTQERTLQIYSPGMHRGLGAVPHSLWNLKRNLQHLSAFKERSDKCEHFKSNYLKIANRRYRSFEEIAKEPPLYDAYICGSDQIWRSGPLSGSQFDPAYYLAFTAHPARIAYAPSFGTATIPEGLRSAYRERIMPIPFLSIREESGKELIKSLTGREADVVLDPALLLSAPQWESVISEPDIDGPYILVYQVDGNYEEMGKVVAHVKKKLPDHKVVALAPYVYAPRIASIDTTILAAGPTEFLGWIRRAAFVCTSSFHGMAFSFTFRKPFYAIMPGPIASRLKSLGNRLSLSQRLLHDLPKDEDPFAMDFSEAEECYEKEKERSLGFLARALGTAAGLNSAKSTD